MATNVKVELRRGESGERLIRRFIKKCKKEHILEIYRDRTTYYIKPSVKRKLKRQKAIREAKKNEAKRNKKMFR
jgi:ribosomal protein S21